MVYMLWHGGCGYAMWNQFDRRDIDECDSIEDAVQLFEDRYHNRLSPDTPCVDRETTEAWVCFEDPFENGDVYPDRIIRFGSDDPINRLMDAVNAIRCELGLTERPGGTGVQIEIA